MPNRRPAPKVNHRDIVNAQQDLLKWCPNVEGVSSTDLQYVCWACGTRSEQHFRTKRGLMIRCHIERYQPNEVECPDNFVLLCERCHSEQPDALPKEALKYWLATREHCERYNDRINAIFRAATNAALKLLRVEFGDELVDFACRVVVPEIEAEVERRSRHTQAEIIAELEAEMESRSLGGESKSGFMRHLGRSAGAGSGNGSANAYWYLFAQLHEWCVANKERVELIMQKVELDMDARLCDDSQSLCKEARAKQMDLFT